MKEIEILVELLDDKVQALAALSGFVSQGEKHTIDVYFADPLRADLQPDASGRLRRCFRLRKKGDVATLTFKSDHFEANDVWTYSDEYETKVDSFEVAARIIDSLGLRELVRIDNTKHIFTNSEYEVVVEEVRGLGTYLEVEKLQQVPDSEVNMAKEEVRSFIRQLNLRIGSELNAGKPELMLAKLALNNKK